MDGGAMTTSTCIPAQKVELNVSADGWGTKVPTDGRVQGRVVQGFDQCLLR